MTLSFYSFGVMLRKQIGDKVTEFPVNPNQIAAALSTKMQFETGLLNSNVIYMSLNGTTKTVVEYREPQKTGIYMDGSEAPIRCPMPGLVLIRRVREGQGPHYLLFAAKERPSTMASKLFNAPLPNVYGNGEICWGSVRRVSNEALKASSLESDWTVLLGTGFNSHGVSGKSKAHRSDIRKQLLALEKRQARVYPVKDLIEADKTLGEALK